jgi:hypothetical protein
LRQQAASKPDAVLIQAAKASAGGLVPEVEQQQLAALAGQTGNEDRPSAWTAAKHSRLRQQGLP